ncbi:rRNA methyltransferase [Corynebacterium phocae]|uniref:rRNA methyltransferase n=1 Tax=Corynebacterium phocae TaxID=161895 RepID=A0A1L7D2U9_9CORY|nr:methyltransferase [Corynebacterium phocae]APT92397.1 rRNA methyltransferase [Corynebacterium phocae]KAA8724989.1 methyltransferase [Corynebacterium phocae]
MNNYFTKLDGRVVPAQVAEDLVAVFKEVGYTADGLAGHLGPEYTEALYRGEPAPVVMATRGGSSLDLVIRAFVLHDPVSLEDLARALGAKVAAQLVDAAVAVPEEPATGEDTQPAGRFVIALDIRPHVIVGRNYWVFSDVDASLVDHVPGPDHVLGVGSASLSLLQSIPTSPVSSVLDLGTGSGVQLLGQLHSADAITGTDVHDRALVLAAATVAGAGYAAKNRVELLQGSWFEPVEGRTFDRVVANPPFVVGMPKVGHVYRDSGLNLDGATELVVSQVTNYLNQGGTAHILGAWIHQGDIPWQQRVASWLPDKGVRAWIIQRDAADPALYVSTWLKDESVDVRSSQGRAQAKAWLEHFHNHDVHGIGFGFVAIQRIADDEPSDVLAEYLPQDFEDALGPEVEEYFLRASWLAGLVPGEIETKNFAPRPGLAKEDISVAGDGGSAFSQAALRLTRTEGPRWSHEVDEHLAAIISGLNPFGLNLEDTVGLYAAAHGFDEGELLNAAVPAIVDLVRHGLVIPSELLDFGPSVAEWD